MERLILTVEIVDVRLSVADLLWIIFVIIAMTKLLNFVILKKITSMLILSGLLVDRKNKFILVGDGKCSFTVAFNAYRQFLWNKYDDSILIDVFNQQHFRNYAYSRRLMIAMLIQLHKDSITEEVIKTLGKLVIPTHQICISALKLAKNAVICLNASNLKLEEAISCHTELNFLKHLFTSIQDLNSANKYLFQSILETKTQERKERTLDIIRSLQGLCDKVDQATTELSSSKYCNHKTLQSLHIFFDGLEESNIENKHTISLVIVDDMAQAAGCVTRPPMDIISYRYDDVKVETINGKNKITLFNSDSYECPSEEVVEMLRDIDCTNIHHQMWGCSTLSIPPEIARWSNLIWFQCTYPWIKQEEVECAIADLICDFLGNAADHCAPGTFVCVGITLHPDYIHKYHLERILEDPCDQYEFLGVDDVLINKLLSYGYKHDSKDIHVTLVFKLKYTYNSYFRRWTQLCIKYKSDHFH